MKNNVPNVVLDFNNNDMLVLLRLLSSYTSNLYFTGDDTGRYKFKENFTIDESFSNNEYVTIKKLARKLKLAVYGSNM
jgi:hypothetical protein